MNRESWQPNWPKRKPILLRLFYIGLTYRSGVFRRFYRGQHRVAVAAEMKTSESLNYMKKITVIGKAVGLVVCLAVSSAQAGGVGCVVDQVLESSKATTITMHEQSFTIEPVKAGDKQKVAYTLAGMIRVEAKSSAAASHEIAYRITKEKGAV